MNISSKFHVLFPLFNVICLLFPIKGDRAAQALFFDGAQYPFTVKNPATPGYVFLSPKQVIGSIQPPWFEFIGSFTIQLWVRPRRTFFGTNVEGGLVSCLVSGYDSNGLNRLSGYGLTVTSNSKLHFKFVEGGILYDLSTPITNNAWIHITAIFDTGLSNNVRPARALLFTCQGTGDLPVLADFFEFPLSTDLRKVQFHEHNDLLLGKLQPFYSPDYYFCGYIDELRFWSLSMAIRYPQLDLVIRDIRDTIYRTYFPDASQLLNQGMVGYLPMNAVNCSGTVCQSSLGTQQWVVTNGKILPHLSRVPSLMGDIGFCSKLQWSDCCSSSPIQSCCTLSGAQISEVSSARTYCMESVKTSNYCWDDRSKMVATCSAAVPNPIQFYGPFVPNGPSCLQYNNLNQVYLGICQSGRQEQIWMPEPKILINQPGTISTQGALWCLGLSSAFNAFNFSTVQLRGQGLYIQICNIANPLSHQLWTVDFSSLQLHHVVSGLCVTYSDTREGSIPFLLDCTESIPPNRESAVESFLMDWSAGHNGVLLGGSYLTSSKNCTAENLCDKSTKAPIDQPPKIIIVNGLEKQVSYLNSILVIGKTYTITLVAVDPNQYDYVQIDYAPLDKRLVGDQSLLWSLLPPSNPCSRTLIWKPTLFTPFTNPVIINFVATDIPSNEFDPNNFANSQSDEVLENSIVVKMPPQFIDPTPPYVCKLPSGNQSYYWTKADCDAFCTLKDRGICKNPDLYVSLGESISFTVQARNGVVSTEVDILFLEDGRDFASPSPTRLDIGSLMPTTQLVTDPLAGLSQITRFNPSFRIWKFTPNAIDAKKSYQSCFLAFTPGILLDSTTTTEVKCVNIHVLSTNPVLDQPSPANESTIVGYVGCRIVFQLAAIKNDSATYDLLVNPSQTLQYMFNNSYISYAKLPIGAVFASLTESNASQTYTFSWVPVDGQEGKWMVCFEMMDSFSLVKEQRCVILQVQRCKRCVSTQETLESLALVYNTNWLELYSVNSKLHQDPDKLVEGSLINVGILYRIPKAQTLPALAKYLYTSPSAIRRFNPDILSDEEILGEFRDICILPQICGNVCGYASTCDRVQIESNFLS